MARLRLRRLLLRVGHDRIAVVAECANATELAKAAASGDIDLVFIDIEMPGRDGFQALAGWRGPRPQIVFVTAYPQHGARAFEIRAVDYLVKPVCEQRLRDTLDRLIPPQPTEHPEEGRKNRIALKAGQRTYFVAPARIDLALSTGNYVEVHAGGSIYTIRATLGEFHALLGASDFIRLHRSSVVRAGAIRCIEPAGSGRYRIVLHNGQTLHSGRQFRYAVDALRAAHELGRGEGSARPDEP
ncbi:LytR/AlgR family response regulator transcription factor [Lysobacter gummosus]|uniref:LytTR family DNA-binding domain-containing protein n=1 Tax=Lysobacter gummosus TaxID=262324 RepID=A0ABY3X9A8_9GAMM|nr:LytTR family DNA-binding domain-containing protein [Lysobacter gummosus]UNP29177.1 LytTR family DNA-binding domain-containing protein [Lysobacter gummosus]